jgi:hypothetical protein
MMALKSCPARTAHHLYTRVRLVRKERHAGARYHGSGDRNDATLRHPEAMHRSDEKGRAIGAVIRDIILSAQVERQSAKTEAIRIECPECLDEVIGGPQPLQRLCRTLHRGEP